MSAWVTVPCLLALRSEFNAINPNRDKGADGTIGDSSHTSASDHTPDEDSDVLRDHDPDSKNEVHALDIDSTGPWKGESFNTLVQRVIAGEKKKWLSATDRCRLKYVIFNRKIYSQSTDFAARDYTGSDPHTNHAHFSARYETSCENDVRSFGVEAAPPSETVGEAMAFIDNQAEFTAALGAALAEGTVAESRVGAAPLNYNGGGLPDHLPEGSNFLNYFTDLCQRAKRIEEKLDLLLGQPES